MHDDIKTVLLTKEEIDARVQEWASRLLPIMQARSLLSLCC